MNEDKNPMDGVTSFSGDEYMAIGAVVEKFFKYCEPQDPPQFMLYTGGVGAGKTTLRRQLPLNQYVQYDFGEIYAAIAKVFGDNNPRLAEYASLGSDIVFKDSIFNRRNIAIEIIGEDGETVTALIEKMKAIGYEVHLNFVNCDPSEAYNRHVKAVGEDPEYASSYFSQGATISPFLSYDLAKLMLG